MKNKAGGYLPLSLGLYCALGISVLTTQARVVDDFNGATKTGWNDFTVMTGAGSMLQQNGQFSFQMPGMFPIGAQSALFCASTKTSESFELKEGRTLEFRVDVVEGGGPRSYAVLGWIPEASGGLVALKGYSFAKSPTDMLLIKGLGQYFIDDDTATVPPQMTNITLVMSLKMNNGAVTIHGEVLDKNQNDAVVWERTFVDTPAADPLGTGTDSPAAPYTGKGNIVLFLYADYDKNKPSTAEDPYKVTYDNLEAFVTDTVVLDDFGSATKQNWSDFTFVPGVGIPTQQNGNFRFQWPGAAVVQLGRQLFSASTKTSPQVEIKEGEKLELSVDVVSGGAKDSFAILSFIPASVGSPAQLKGYSFAKSTTDVLIVKGVGQYFVAAAGPAANLKQTNITMVMSFTTRNGTVTIDASVLDKDANNSVIWHQRVKDTPAADVLAQGSDSPATPYVGLGNVALMLFADYDQNNVEDPYEAVFDNLMIARSPVVANAPPIITDVTPADRANFLPASTQITFKISDDQALSDADISVVLNGTNYTVANGLTLTGTGNSRQGSLGGLKADVDYTAEIKAKDSNGDSASKVIYFDTFAANRLTLEIENYNYGGGQFIDNPIIVPELNGDVNSYSMQTAVDDVDYFDTRPGAAGFGNGPFRPDDKARQARSRDNVRAKYTAAGGGDAGVYDYDVGDIAAGEWLNYTHTFAAGSYEVYLRQAVANLPTAESVLEKVTSDPTQPGQTTQVLGSFLAKLTGFTYRNFPLTDASGQNKVVLRLDGKTTLRLRQVTADTGDGNRLQNYMVFIPVADAGVQRAAVSQVAPASGTTVQTVNPVVSATIENRDTSVTTSSIKLEVNGSQVAAVVTPTTTGATVTWTMDPLPQSGTANVAKVSYNDNQNTNLSTTWQFIVSYAIADPALKVAGIGKDRGFNVRVVQAQIGQQTDNSLTFAENLLSPNTTYLKQYDTNVVAQVINFSQQGPGSSDGSFPDDELIPGLDIGYSSDDIAMEATTYLDLPAGKYRFGVNSDDGYKVQIVPSFTARGAQPLAFHNGPANETFDFVVTQSGLYPFRFVWYERGGGAHVEWFQGNFSNGTRVLLNSTGALAAYASVDALPQFGPATITGGLLHLTWTGSGTLQESSDLKNWTDVAGQPAGSYTTPVNTAIPGKYYRIKR